MNRAEQTIDELEQAAFIASLLPSEVAPELLRPLADVCSAAVVGAESAASGATAAADVPEGQRIDSEDALAAVGRLIEAEHKADAAERAVTATVLRGEFDLKTALSVLELARAVERATDQMLVSATCFARACWPICRHNRVGCHAHCAYWGRISCPPLRGRRRCQGVQSGTGGRARAAGATGLCAANQTLHGNRQR